VYICFAYLVNSSPVPPEIDSDIVVQLRFVLATNLEFEVVGGKNALAIVQALNGEY